MHMQTTAASLLGRGGASILGITEQALRSRLLQHTPIMPPSMVL